MNGRRNIFTNVANIYYSLANERGPGVRGWASGGWWLGAPVQLQKIPPQISAPWIELEFRVIVLMFRVIRVWVIVIIYG